MGRENISLKHSDVLDSFIIGCFLIRLSTTRQPKKCSKTRQRNTRKNLFGLSFTHMKDNVKTIQSQFELGSRSIGTEIIPIWQKWTQIPHTLADMTEFLDSRDYIKNEKKKERILVKYE